MTASASAQTVAQPGVSLRPAASRGTTRIGWLDSKHSFSFGQYHDPQRMGYHGLRVINDDRVAATGGFPTHPHRDMEIITWVLDGQLAHRDSMGHASALGVGGVQYMSAGSGVTHSEFNPSETRPAHFLQIWISPSDRGLTPQYAEATTDPADRDGKLLPLATTDGRDGSFTIRGDAQVYVGDFAAGQAARLPLADDRVAYVHVATGSVDINGQPASAGDAVTLEGPPTLDITGRDDTPAQVLVFDLPA